ncbi:MAG: hypothetical protein LBT04_02855 [Prevotellaceae bacterium]|nr:hypothetical protein [Prevotellaceae bacterium]
MAIWRSITEVNSSITTLSGFSATKRANPARNFSPFERTWNGLNHAGTSPKPTAESAAVTALKSPSGATKPINHDFWKTYYPPNGWRYRCEAIQLPYSGAAEVEPMDYPPVPPMFKTNLAKTGLIFPKGHPIIE